MNKLLHQNGVHSDVIIIQKVLVGDVPLFEVLIRRYNPVLYKIARGYGLNHQDAEDAMQEAHVAAYFNLKKFENRSSYKTWISKILIHKCLYKQNHGTGANEQPNSNSLSDEGTHMYATGQSVDAERVILNRELSQVLESSLQHLPLSYRSVFLLREIEGFSVAETAELLHITPVNVKVRLNRAKIKLQKHLERYYSSGELYEFNLVYCDLLVKRVFDTIATAPEDIKKIIKTD